MGVTQKTFSEAKDLAEHLLDLELPGGSLITVDGMDGSGKSHLARKLAKKLSTRHVEIDNFLNQKRGGFLDHIRYTELADTLQRDDGGATFVVEGCCILEVMRRVEGVPDLKIYLKHKRVGQWACDFLAKYENAEDAIAGETEAIRNFKELFSKLEESDAQEQSPAALPPLRKELIDYHFEYLPHEKADLIFVRSE